VESVAPFILLMKPGIVGAVLLAGFTGMVLAERGWPDPTTALICLASLSFAAAGSAMLNCLIEAPLDIRMARLQTRVAALEKAGRGRVLAIALIGICASAVLTIRYLSPLTLLLILAAVLSYTLLYTVGCKRRSPWGTVIGGIPGALPVLIGYAATGHSLGPDGIILFTIIFLWQPPHFWALALEYRHDYRAAGLPVLPVTHGESYTKKLILILATALLPVSLSLWFFGFCSAWYAAFALLSGLAFPAALYYLIVRRGRFVMAFSASILYLTLLLLAIVGDICLVQGGIR
jgi:protoheme IX farnesyltransferase